MREKTRRGRLNEYGNEYGKYAACVLSGFVLYGLSEAVGEIGDPVRDGVLARNEYGGGDRQYELLVEGLENGEEQVKVTVPERKMSDAEVQKLRLFLSSLTLFVPQFKSFYSTIAHAAHKCQLFIYYHSIVNYPPLNFEEI